VGRLLNMHANNCAKIVLEGGIVRHAAHGHAIHNSAIVEAFPSSFLGLLITDPTSLLARRRGRSDIFYAYLVRARHSPTISIAGHARPATDGSPDSAEERDDC
jgi:hypothetical protein